MTYALIAISRTGKRDMQTDERWYSFLETLQTKIDSTPAIQNLAENILLLPLDETLLVFAEIIRRCNEAGYQSKTVFFEEKPNFITS